MDILKAKENIIVHQVNELGVMGAGLALQIKNTYPKVYVSYKKYANSNCIGKIQLIKINNNQFICNMFSQKGISRYKQTTDYKAMEECLKKLNEYASKNNYTIALPYKIGCGLAGGDWNIVANLIKDNIKVDYKIYKK